MAGKTAVSARISGARGVGSGHDTTLSGIAIGLSGTKDMGENTLNVRIVVGLGVQTANPLSKKLLSEYAVTAAVLWL